MHEFTPPQRETLRRALEAVDRRCLGHEGKQSERLLPPDRRADILAEYETGNNALARRHFGRDRLFEMSPQDKETPLAQMSIPSSNTDLIEQFVAPLLHELVHAGTLKAHSQKGAQP